MCDITKSNFESMYNDIVKAIEEAFFIAIDAEFTCLDLNNSLKPSLNDTVEMRYNKLRRNIAQSSVCQIGVSAFVPNESKENSYSVQTFNFYLFPHTFGPVDSRFVFQASSVEFLCEHDFDFNKFIYEGIPYLNKDQEENLRKMHKLGQIKHHCDSLKMRDFDENQLRKLLVKIDEWKLGAESGDRTEYFVPEEGINRYILLADLQERFKDIKCKLSEDEIQITKCDELEAVRRSFDEEFERLFQIQIGFSRLIQVISSSRKPVVGHNCLRDLIFIFEKFHKTLPENYKDFKKQLHDLFPVIYDTKHVSFLLRNAMRDKTALFNETNLEHLHRMLSRIPGRSTRGTFYVLYSPFIQHAPGFDRYVDDHHMHEAGFDAYLAGYVFIRMAHFLAAKDTKSTDMRPLPFRRQLLAVKEYENCVNVARATLRYVNFGGNDPPSRVPARFIVTSKTKNTQPFSANEIAHEFLPFGSVDVHMESSKKAIVAVSNRGRAKDVVEAFRYHRKYKVVPFLTFSIINKKNLLSIGCGMVLLAATGSIIYLIFSSET